MRLTAMPAVIHGSWTALVGLGIVIGILALLWFLSFEGIPAGPALIVALVTVIGGTIGAKLWYVVLRPRRWRQSLSEGWSIDGSIGARTDRSGHRDARPRPAGARVPRCRGAGVLRRRRNRSPRLLLHRLLRRVGARRRAGACGRRIGAWARGGSRHSSWRPGSGSPWRSSSARWISQGSCPSTASCSSSASVPTWPVDSSSFACGRMHGARRWGWKAGGAPPPSERSLAGHGRPASFRTREAAGQRVCLHRRVRPAAPADQRRGPRPQRAGPLQPGAVRR